MPAKRQTSFSCPDCDASCAIDGIDTIRHVAPCASADALDTVTAQDVEWFATHPAAPYRWRPLELAEYAELLTAGADIGGRWRARVQPHPIGMQRTLCRDGAAVIVVLTEAQWRWAA